jgi:hypothetical protein
LVSNGPVVRNLVAERVDRLGVRRIVRMGPTLATIDTSDMPLNPVQMPGGITTRA